MKTSRLILAIISNVLYEAVIVAAILWGLPRIGVYIPVWGTVLICIAFAVYGIVMYRIGSRALRRKLTPGFTDMIGTEGRVVSRLSPEGFVRIKGELWEAKAEEGSIDTGIDVIVVKQSGMLLIVNRKNRMI